MKVLITGISGFLANYLAISFLKKEFKVFGLTHSAINRQFEKVQYVNINLPDQRIYELIKKEQPDIVIHAAGTASVPKSVQDPFIDFSISVPGTAMLLDALRIHKPDAHFIFFSSAAVYGNPKKLPITENCTINPISPYGYHKRMGELLCEEYAKVYDLNCSVLRIFSAYGKGLNRQVVFEIIKKIFFGESQNSVISLFGTGKESRDFIHANDVVEAVNCIINAKKKGFDVFNCASGIEVSISELAALIIKNSGREIEVQFNGVVRKGDPINWSSDISNLSSLGFLPKINLESGIQEMINWVRNEHSN